MNSDLLRILAAQAAYLAVLAGGILSAWWLDRRRRRARKARSAPFGVGKEASA